VSTRHRAQAVPIPTHDLAAATITTLDRKILIVAAYDVRLGGSDAADNEQLRGKLRLIKEAYNNVQNAHLSGRVDLLFCADFNRHYIL